MSASHSYSFGEYSLDLRRGALLRDGADVKLRPKSFALLRVLIERHGQLVSRKELLQSVWGHAAVTDGALGQCVIDVRRALGDNSQQIIRTVPRRGYIFDAPVIEICEPPPSTKAAAPRTPPALPSHRRLWLGVLAAVVAAGGWALWVSTATGERVMQRLDTQNRDAATPQSAEASERVARARFFYNRRMPGDIERAEELFEQALAIDPRSGHAWEGLAGVYGVQVSMGDLPIDSGLAKRGQAVQQALVHGPDLAAVHVRAARHYSGIGAVELAQQHRKRAHALDPDNALVLFDDAHHLALAGRVDEAAESVRRVVMHDPLSTTARGVLAGYLLAAGRYDEARAELLREIELNPANKAEVEPILVRIHILKGEYAQARRLILAWPHGVEQDQGMVMIEHQRGAHVAARAALQRLAAGSDAQAALRLAEIYAHWGDAEQAFRWMEETRARLGVEAKESPQHRWAWELRFSPFLRPLHTDARWRELNARLFASSAVG